MTDRELLELAAKAAGINIFGWTPGGHPTTDGAYTGIWNPLTDDGDALRLAVRLHIKVLIGDAWSVDHSTGEHRTLFRVSPDEEPCQYAATRRAITRAAAEIGRSMP